MLSPAWTTDWMSEQGRQKLREYGIAPPQPGGGRRALFGVQQVACPQCGSDDTEVLSEFGSTVLQGAVALPQLPRTVRLFQMSLNMSSSVPRFHRLAVSDLRRESADAVSLTFAIPQALADDYRFAPGQYLTLRTTLDGEEVRRSYSICSGPDDGELRIAVKKVDGGAFSSWAADELKAGDATRRHDADRPLRRRAGAGARRGSMSASPPAPASRRSFRSSRACWRASRTAGSSCSTATVRPRGMLFREALEELKDRFMQRLSLFHVISGEEQDIPILHGRLDGEKVEGAAAFAGPRRQRSTMSSICGPTGMSEDIEATCRDLGIAADRIHVERFVSEFGGKPRAEDGDRGNGAAGAPWRR